MERNEAEIDVLKRRKTNATDSISPQFKSLAHQAKNQKLLAA
jgi:hypothetical protein